MNDPMITLSELVQECGGIYRGPERVLPLSLTINSRSVKKGDVFVAIKGEHADGHSYIEDAVSAGAVGIIGERAKLPEEKLAILDPDSTITFILAPQDTITFLTRLAQGYLEKVCPREVIAVTGSVGKTTTREMIKKVLSCRFQTASPISSYNTLLGCSLTILGMPCNTEMLILEMGTNSPGEISQMVAAFRPTLGVITEVTEAHLQGLVSFDGVLRAKMELMESTMMKCLIYNWDNIQLRNEVNKYSRKMKLAGVGFQGGYAHIDYPEFRIHQGKPLLNFRLHFPDYTLNVQSRLFGSHQALCLSMALNIAHYLDLPLQSIPLEALGLESLPGRGSLILLPEDNILLIDDSYNANPQSMNAALNVIEKISWKGRKIAVLGTMKELGGKTPLFHKEILERTFWLDVLLLVGEEWREALQMLKEGTTAGDLIWVSTYKEAIDILKGKICPGDLILVKGSHSNELEKVVSCMVNGK
ncbi:MAG: UDP-N-acetylmuramoyl-tripeptide--D-alanyl-D-alanine ligase [Synergistales bacterium]|nr:UDP-N-acetylmuramoyl-tripeptide--D-alanyl-D-alanine ligase [Synergistales bacterium]